ncbi:hypothetical protein MKX03_003213 [Papaver bracteatum]|nr:hypothetical protein MKX03_003213 [Papaver bracteatum]
MWVRQRENFPLTARLFKDVPEENVKRLVQLVRDHFKLEPDDDLTEQLLRRKMRVTYNGYRSSLSKHYRLECDKDYDKALANPPKNCTNMEDWTSMCNLFKMEEFQVLHGEPTDPITMFDATHKFKKSTDPTCETIKV